MKFLSSVNDLGVVLDERLEMEEQIGNICRSGFYHLRQIRGIRRSLSDVAARSAVQAFIMTKVDYCNSALLGLSATMVDWVQHLVNAAARLILRLPKFSHIFGSDEGWSALASCPKADTVQDPADDMEVYFRKCPWLSPGTLLSPLYNTGTSSASIDGDKSLPARRTQGQDSYNTKEGFRPRGGQHYGIQYPRHSVPGWWTAPWILSKTHIKSFLFAPSG